MIGGNITAEMQTRTDGGFNAIGERVNTWGTITKLWGWLDLISGESNYSHNAKIENSTHIFVSDYYPINKTAEDKRLVCDGQAFDVLLIDDPMNLHQQLEIYLKKVI